jgi:transcriptional regulator with XRE-family HTH domain
MQNATNINGALGRRITELCAGNHLTMTELARRSAVSRTTLWRVRRGERVSPGTLGRVSSVIAGAALLAPSNGTLDTVDLDDLEYRVAAVEDELGGSDDFEDRLTTVEEQLADLELRIARFSGALLHAVNLGAFDREHEAA